MRARTALVLSLVAPYFSSALHASIVPMSAFVTDNQEDANRRVSLGLDKKDVDSIFGDLTMRRINRSDCHSKVASRLQAICGGGENNAADVIGESDKSAIAISLTICSMASALQPTPTECFPWSPPELAVPGHVAVTKTWSWNRIAADERLKEAQRTKCLGALHRSPQDWSSYNGYLSDATQLCFAFGGKRQAEIAQRTYVNATMEKIALINFLMRNEQSRRAQEEKVSDNLNVKLNNLQSVADLAKTALDGLSIIDQQQSGILRDMRSAVDGIDQSTICMVQRVEIDLKRHSLQLLSEVESSLKNLKQNLADEMSSEFKGIAENHSASLTGHLSTYEVLTAKLISAAEGQMAIILGRTAERAAAIDDNWNRLSVELRLAKTDMNGIAETAIDIRPLLLSSLESALQIKNLQNEAAASLEIAAVHSTQIVHELTHSSAAINDHLNSTLVAISEWRETVPADAWWRHTFPLTIFQLPSLFSQAWGSNASSHQHLAIALQGVVWIFGLVCQAILMGVYGLVSVLSQRMTESPAHTVLAAARKTKFKIVVPDAIGIRFPPTISHGTLRKTQWVVVERRAVSEPP
ncbi:MAG: hypothetical protein TREMPRED_005980 [Tremellales sp. Tagirdzhanova-0007]|nr:MAG: hypothetical protein TREMPRED_005980 [Tremellales sp. Tagirdzhanova-0007]